MELYTNYSMRRTMIMTVIAAFAALSLHFGVMPIMHSEAMDMDEGCGVVMSCLPTAADACIKHCLGIQRGLRAIVAALPYFAPIFALMAFVALTFNFIRRERIFATQAIGPPGLMFVKHTVMRC